MISANHDKWGSWTHDEPRQPETDTTRSNVYDMYPMDWSRASDAQRDADEVRQYRGRDANGGMGFPSDYGESFRIATAETASHPLGALIAEKTIKS